MSSSPGSSPGAADDRLDLRGTPCPINFVRAKLKLQQMPPGQWLELWLDAGEPIEQVPASLSGAGFVVEPPVPQPGDGGVNLGEQQRPFFALRVQATGPLPDDQP